MDQAVALIGFGEAASAFARNANWVDRAIAFDIAQNRQSAMADLGVGVAQDRRQALGRASTVLSLVTADQALIAAEQCAGSLREGALWLDMNSVAPETKRSAARIVERAGGHYVDIAIMAPVAPASSSVPLLLAGPEAERANAALTRLGFSNLRTAGLTVGAASGIKMCRSIMVKGIEALTAEMMAAANLEGVSELVLASLEASERQLDWTHRASYNLHRIAEHGQRRAAEMDQVVEYLTAIGVDPVMSRATAQRQRTGSVAGSQQGRTA